MIDPDLVRFRVLSDPVCELIGRDGRYCRRLSVSATETMAGLRARCHDHAPPEAPRICVACRSVNADAGGHPTRCAFCRASRYEDP
jgi:hypothetical protein